MGASQYGIFLHLNSGRVIFLSYEGFRGPLTVNIGEDARDTLPLELGATAKVNPDCISFPTLEARIVMGTGRIWQAPQPATIASAPDQRRARLVEVAIQLFAMEKTSQVGSALPALLGFRQAGVDQAQIPLKSLVGIRDALEQRDSAGIAGALRVLCGMGRGLTPSGDDLITGFILALNRWGDTLAPELDLEKLNSDVIQIAYQGTTTLAANLIECASRGQADERLLLALDDRRAAARCVRILPRPLGELLRLGCSGGDGAGSFSAARDEMTSFCGCCSPISMNGWIWMPSTISGCFTHHHIYLMIGVHNG